MAVRVTFGNDRIRVFGPVTIDMGDGLRDAIDNLNRQHRSHVFRIPIVFTRCIYLTGVRQKLHGFLTATELDPFGNVFFRELW